METTFDAVNPGKFADFTNQKIKLLKRKYIGLALLTGVVGFIIGGIFVYELMDDKNSIY